MRKVKAKRRELAVDPKFGDRMVTRFVNELMYSGKKSVAFKIRAEAVAIPLTPLLKVTIPSATIFSEGAALPSSILAKALSVAPASTITMSISPLGFKLPATTISNTESSNSEFVA